MAQANPLWGAWNSITGQTDYQPNPLKYDPAQSNQSRQAGQNAIGQLDTSNSYYMGLLRGNQPSVAEQQTRLATAQAQQQGMQAASGARGVDRAAAFRQAQANASGLAGQAAVQGGVQRMQERQQQMQLGAQGYGAGVGAQAGYYQNQRGQDVSEQQGQEALQNQQNAINAQIAMANAANEQASTSGMVQLGGKVIGAMFSDINAKTDIRPLEGGDNIHPLDGVKPYEYRYKDAFAQHMAQQAGSEAYARTLADAKTPRSGVMAQDLARNPEASQTVMDTPEGLAIDGKRGMSLLLANQAELNERLRRIESGNRQAH